MRIFRTLVLLTGIAVFLPSPPDDGAQNEPTQAAAEISTFGLIGGATSAFADAASFCTRQAEACRVAGSVAGKLGAKAKYSVRLIYEWASEPNAETSDPIKTGSTAVVPGGNGQSSLRLDDLIPPWREPAAAKKS
ncbi:MAG: DUF5330 domain-containing protein [Aestuariivirga sp.]